MKTVFFFLVLFLLPWSGLGLSAEPGVGELKCIEAESDRCRIAWNLIDSPRSQIRVERFDASSDTWIVEATDNNSYGTSEVLANPGSLYRVIGCNTGAQPDCVSSSVYWVPVVPNTTADIPDFVYRKNGGALAISKGVERLSTQTIQYNVYLFVRDFENIDLAQFPEMSEPAGELTNLQEVIQYNIYPNYMGYRDTALGNPPKPTPEYQHARPIHPEGHPEHKHDETQ